MNFYPEGNVLCRREDLKGIKTRIASISFRKVFNSHVRLTNEFTIETVDGLKGTGAAPEGETISIYEDRECKIEPSEIINKIVNDGICDNEIGQEDFDSYLDENIAYFGRNNSYALSLAFFNAMYDESSYFDFFSHEKGKLNPPVLCLNILNGGWHAYTNPVLSDFHEYLVVPKSNDIEEVIEEHEAIQRLVRERLSGKEKVIVGGNPVNLLGARDNRVCIEFLKDVLTKLGLDDKYGIMIDASGGDLWKDGSYRLDITDAKAYSREEFIEYWQSIINDYGLTFLEDPFREEDYDSWRELTKSSGDTKLIGDNFYSSDYRRIDSGAREGYTHGVIVKPNQAGTVTSTVKAIRTAQKHGQIVISSHRSISTEYTTFLPLVTCMCDVGFIKIGPLYTDYSSVLRLNEFIRLTEG